MHPPHWMLEPKQRTQLELRDARDVLAHVRGRFALPATMVYLDGNSLGPPPHAVTPAVAATLDAWGEHLIGGWTQDGWIDLPQRIGADLSRIIGAQSHEVIVGDSTSVNLFRMVCTGLALQPDRRAVVLERGNFPADNYIVQGIDRMLDGRLELRWVEATALLDRVDDDVALVVASHVGYHDGRMLDLAAVTRGAHERGALMLWDLSHSAGIVPLDVHDAEVDLAVGCTYKYLNGGPGAPAYAYLHERWHERAVPPVQGWLGHAAPFAFEPTWRAAPGMRRFVAGTPMVLSLVALQSALTEYRDVSLAALREKSLALTRCFMELVDEHCRGLGIQIMTPRHDTERGSQVSLAFEHAYPAIRALAERGIIGDFREPNVMRFGFAPMYVGFVDVGRAVEGLVHVLSTRAWDDDRLRQRGYVT